MAQSRSIVREVGTALAVLALYLLTILTPLHQARATQLDFAAAGYQTIETGWVLCTPDTDRGESKSLVTKCPAAGIVKQSLVEPALAVIELGTRTPVRVRPQAETIADGTALHLNPATPPRAPPVLV